MSERLFYINGSWLNYSEAHSLGYTLNRPQIDTFYTSDFQPVDIRKDVDSDTYYDSNNHTWYSDISSFSPKLYLRLGQKILYKSETKLVFHYSYADSVNDSSPEYVDYNSTMTSIEDLYQHYGITDYACQPYLVQDGNLLVWYDEINDMYWDNRQDHLEWVSSPPVIKDDFDQQDISIIPSLDKLNTWDLFDESTLPISYCPRVFYEQQEYLATQQPMLVGFQFIDFIEPTQDKFYEDSSVYDVRFYVMPEEGITTEYDGVFHPQGDYFIGDLQEVWVEADEDTNFWRGSDTFVFGKTSDEFHQLDVNPLYWCSSAYLTYSDLHAAGYTLTPAKTVEIWDSSFVSTTSILAYQQDGTESACEMLSSAYRISSLGSNFYTEYQINNLGWYVKWRLYSLEDSVALYDNYINGNIILNIPSGITVVGNPYLIFEDNSRQWQRILYITSSDPTLISVGYIDVTSLPYTLNYTTNSICKVDEVPSHTLDILLGRSWNGSQFTSRTSGKDNWCWACLMNQIDQSTIEDFGLTVGYPSSSNSPFGFIMWNSNYTYECLGAYSDIDGTYQIQVDPSTLECIKMERSGYTEQGIMAVITHQAINTPIMTWKVRITA